MTTHKFTSPVLWLSQDEDDGDYYLHEAEPHLTKIWRGVVAYRSGKLVDVVSASRIHRLFGYELDGKGKCRVKITIEVLD